MGIQDNGSHITSSQLDSLLAGEDPEFVAKVLQIVRETGLRPNDPLFMILASTSILRVLLEDAPQQLKATYDYCNQDMLNNLSAYEAAAAKGTEKRIATAVDQLVEKTQISKARLTAQTALPVGLMFVITLALGVLGGLSFVRWQDNQVAQDPTGRRQLTLEEANALNWALSKEGKLAKNIMDWNENLANRGCERDIKELGITYRLGNKQAVSGFCTVWVAPASDRKFVKAKNRN